MLSEIEAEISCWTTSKPILTARRLRKDGTRGLRLGDIVEMQNYLVNGVDEPFAQDPSREARILSRANHTLGHGRDLWAKVLSGE